MALGRCVVRFRARRGSLQAVTLTWSPPATRYVAKAMRDFPVLLTAMAAGDMSFAKARMLVPHLTEEHADELVEPATTAPTSHLAIAIATWSQRNANLGGVCGCEPRGDRNHAIGVGAP